MIASIYDKYLYEVDLDKVVQPGTTASDSAILVQVYVDKWLRDQVIVVEAEKYIAADINIDRLVDDYRSSLLSYSYEKRLIEDQLDTVISTDDYQEMYDNQAEQLLLSHSIATYELIVIPADAKRIDLFLTDWRADNKSKVDAYIRKYARRHIVDTTTFIELTDLLRQLPPSLQKKTYKKGSKHFGNYDKQEYFVTIIDYYGMGQAPPLHYIKETLRKRILHDRKLALLHNIKNNLYDIAVRNNKVKINKPKAEQ